VNIFNVGCDSACEVHDSIGWICTALGVTPHIEYSGGDRGWPGDNPVILLDSSRLRALGWKPQLTIREAMLTTLTYLIANPLLVDARR
jgi:UDP-glucose 4-epimerase